MKKGFIFSMDAFLAIVLFVLVVFLIYVFSASYPGLGQQYFFSEDLLITMSGVKINELNLADYTKINQLKSSGKIEDDNILIVDQIVIFQQRGDNQAAKDIIEDIINKINTQNFNTAFFIGSEQVYGNDPTYAQNLLTRTRLVIGEK